MLWGIDGWLYSIRVLGAMGNRWVAVLGGCIPRCYGE